MSESGDVHEQAWIAGNRAAWAQLLQTCLINLGYSEQGSSKISDKAEWAVERENALRVIRELCALYGNADFPSNLNLGDILENYLAPFLPDPEEE